MSKELIVSAGRHEIRVAIIEDDQLVEIFHEREKEYSLAGSIHKGRVTRVLPGMQSAFVDIGLDRDAFLYVSDFFEDTEEYDAVVSTVEDKVLKLEKQGGIPADRALASGMPIDEIDLGPVEGDVPEGEAAPQAARAVPSGEDRGPRPERGGDRGGADRGADRGGDRGGRGRRGRRRRGAPQRAGGLPESKYAVPVDDAPPPASLPEVDEEFLVLPGESLAKYAAGDVRSEDEDDRVSPEAAAPPSVPRIHPRDYHREAPLESALPDEHPLAGFGSFAAWATPRAKENPRASAAPVAEIVAESPAVVADSHDEPELVAFAAPAVGEHPAAPEEATEEEVNELIAEAVAESKAEAEAPAAEAPVAEEVKAEEEAHFDAVEEATAEGEGMVETDVVLEAEAVAEGTAEGADEVSGEAIEGEATAEGEGEDPEGPEPARIPTSLTAQLREQGHRYPHRVSRRMRRRNRQAEGGERKPEDGQAAPAEVVEGAEGEVREVEVRGEDSSAPLQAPQQPRPERGERNGRGDRGRNRGERGDRGERGGDRGDRGERTERPAAEAGAERTPRERVERERPPLPSITDLLKAGQEIIVQIAKEPLGQKGARITSHVALPGRFVVYMPSVDHAGVSRKIPSDEERSRLKRVLQTHRQGIPGGFICRTAAEGKSEEELRADMHFLYNLWLDLRQKAEKKPAPALLHHDLDLVQRILRDQLTANFKSIWVDNEELYTSVLNFVERFQPALIGRVKLYTRSAPIFDEFGITAELEKALRPKVWLKSGGYIVINQTEALVAIDINTGKYVGKSNRLEDTIVKVNTDAIKEIVRQIRLRDLGGIIVVDFIDMDERRNRQKVMQALEESMRADRAPYKILQFNDFGLVAITRKRVKQSLERTLCAPCPYCEGAGYVKSVQTVITEILTEAQRMRKALQSEQSNLVLRVNPEVAKVLKSNHNSFLQEIEELLGRTVMIKSDPLLHQTKFDLV